jgi:hypothetical protein
MSAAIHRLSTANLRALAASLRSGPLSLGLSKHSVAQIAGSQTDGVLAYLETLVDTRMSTVQAAFVIEAIAETRDASADLGQAIDLILSGPEVPGIVISDTIATVRTLVAEATHEVVLVGYAIHNARSIFELLASRMSAQQMLKVIFCLDISRRRGDTSLEFEIVRRFAIEFREKHWPWLVFPDVYYDARSLSEDPLRRSSLHAKCVITDRKRAIITSANFTEAAWRRNIEVGVLVRHEPLVARLAAYVDGLILSQFLSRLSLV